MATLSEFLCSASSHLRASPVAAAATGASTVSRRRSVSELGACNGWGGGAKKRTSGQLVRIKVKQIDPSNKQRWIQQI